MSVIRTYVEEGRLESKSSTTNVPHIPKSTIMSSFPRIAMRLGEWGIVDPMLERSPQNCEKSMAEASKWGSRKIETIAREAVGKWDEQVEHGESKKNPNHVVAVAVAATASWAGVDRGVDMPLDRTQVRKVVTSETPHHHTGHPVLITVTRPPSRGSSLPSSAPL